MILSAVFEHAQSFDTPLVVEYYYRGEKLETPKSFFEKNSGLFELAFPSAEETIHEINKYLIYRETHKLVISEYGFHLIHL